VGKEIKVISLKILEYRIFPGFFAKEVKNVSNRFLSYYESSFHFYLFRQKKKSKSSSLTKASQRQLRSFTFNRSFPKVQGKAFPERSA